MTSGSTLQFLLQLFVVVVSVSGQQVPLPNNILQFKTPHGEQYQYRQGYQFTIPGGSPQYHDPAKLNVVPQSVPHHHEYTQKTRSVYTEEYQTPNQPESVTTPHQPTYYPLHISQPKDLNAENAAMTNKLIGLATALARNPKPDVKIFDLATSSSEVHPEVCAPPKPPAPQPTPCSQSQPIPSPQPTPCASQPVPQSPPPTPCSPPKPEIVTPAPKVIPQQNPFLSEQQSALSKSSYVSVSPCHSSAKYSEESDEAPCSPPSPPPKEECDSEPEKKLGFPVIPAERQLVCNPFSEIQRERFIPLPNQKGILHHRLHADENLEYPEGYMSRPGAQLKPVHVPYVVTYPGQHPNVGKHMGYAYVPLPSAKPIPLVVPPEKQVEEDGEDEHDVVSHPGRSSRRYEDDKDWSRNILRDIAEKLGAIMDEEGFRNYRRSSRPDRGYDDERYEDEGYPSRNYARSNGDYYQQDYDDGRWKERKYSRGSSY